MNGNKVAHRKFSDDTDTLPDTQILLPNLVTWAPPFQLNSDTVTVNSMAYDKSIAEDVATALYDSRRYLAYNTFMDSEPKLQKLDDTRQYALTAISSVLIDMSA